MPLYEYQCDACGANLEVLQRVSDEPLTECVKCDGRVRKVVSRTSFQFKGTGWYVTDYARKGGEAGSSGTSESKTETKTETKTDTTAATCGAGACGACD